MNEKEKDFESLMNSVFGSGKTLNFSKDFVKKDKKTKEDEWNDDILSMQKELMKMNERASSIKPLDHQDLLDNANQINQQLLDLEKLKAQAMNDFNESDLDRIRSEIERDFGIEVKMEKADSFKNPVEKKADFTHVLEELNESVIGQKEYNQTLVNAFKRPFIMGNEGEFCLNTILICGNAATGKKYSIFKMGEICKKHQILSSEEVIVVNCALYSSSENEKIFYQDLYSALNSASNILYFKDFEKIYTGFIPVLVDLVDNGEINLNKRYVFQKEQLVDTGTGLVQHAISSLNAEGKYLIFATTFAENKIANIFSAHFINCFHDRLYTQAEFERESLERIADRILHDLMDRTQRFLVYDIHFEDSYKQSLIDSYQKEKGIQSLLDEAEMIYEALAQIKLNEEIKENSKVIICYDNEQRIAVVADRKINLDAYSKKDYNHDVEAVKKQLERIVGLDNVKRYVLSLEDNYNVMKLRKKQGLKVTEVSKHMIFTGNPGTGKTTIARLIAQYLKAIGILSGGQLVEVTRSDLVGRYVGHTAPLTTQVIKSAIGGVLFIDEAYSLYRGKDDSFGLEAIDTIVKGIEDNRENLIVILAGYTKEMNEFLTANSGLKSRFPNIIEFPDYTPEEMVQIAKITAEDKDYILNEEVEEPLKSYFLKVQMQNSETSGNGRLVRNTIEQAILNQSSRVLKNPECKLNELLLQDFQLN